MSSRRQKPLPICPQSTTTSTSSFLHPTITSPALPQTLQPPSIALASIQLIPLIPPLPLLTLFHTCHTPTTMTTSPFTIIPSPPLTALSVAEVAKVTTHLSLFLPPLSLVVRSGGVAVILTDTLFALACDQCRKSKCKCERSSPNEPCKSCIMLGTRKSLSLSILLQG